MYLIWAVASVVVISARVAPSKKPDLLREIIEKDATKKKKTIIFSNKVGTTI